MQAPKASRSSMLFLNGETTLPADAFPLQAGRSVTEEDKSTSLPHDTSNKISVAEIDRPPLETINEKSLIRDLSRGAPGDENPMALAQRRPEEKDRSTRKSNYFGEVFAYREANTSVKERATRESVITAEVKTNVIVCIIRGHSEAVRRKADAALCFILKVKDEYSFITDLSTQISQRYQRPQAFIMIMLDHSSCLMYGGSFDPAYMLTISALPAQLMPTTNKRNASLIQQFFTESLNVPADRGIVRFIAIPEENLASDGMTVMGIMENQNRASMKEQSLDRRMSRQRMGSMSRPKRSETIKEIEPAEKRRSRSVGSDGAKPNESAPPIPPLPMDINSLDKQAEKVQKMGKRKSILNMFNK